MASSSSVSETPVPSPECLLDWTQIEQNIFALIEQIRARTILSPSQNNKNLKCLRKYPVHDLFQALATQLAHTNGLHARQSSPARDMTQSRNYKDSREYLAQQPAKDVNIDPRLQSISSSAASDGTRALVCLQKYFRHKTVSLHTQYNLDQFRALIDSNLLFDSVAMDDQKVSENLLADLETRMKRLECRADDVMLPVHSPPSQGPSVKLEMLEKSLDKVRIMFCCALRHSSYDSYL